MMQQYPLVVGWLGRAENTATLLHFEKFDILLADVLDGRHVSGVPHEASLADWLPQIINQGLSPSSRAQQQLSRFVIIEITGKICLARKCFGSSNFDRNRISTVAWPAILPLNCTVSEPESIHGRRFGAPAMFLFLFVMPIAALLTPPGRGAVATIAYRGPVALIDGAGSFRAANGKPLAQQALNRTIFGCWGPPPGEEIVVCRTSSDSLEIHCHGGHAASEAILADLGQLECERLDPWEFLERGDGRFERQAAEAFAHAATPRTAAIIARQTAGALREALDELASDSLSREQRRERIESLLKWSELGTHLIEPWDVVLFGRPNVGKSSLMNALVGFERAIVLDAPGTTRDLVTAEIALDGWPIRLTDTAGQRSDADELESAGIERAQAGLERADLRLYVLDCTVEPSTEEYAQIPRGEADIIIANKVDLVDPEAGSIPPGAIAVSAKTGAGLPTLIDAIVKRLVPRLPGPDDAVPVMREQITLLRSAREALKDQDDERACCLCRSLV